MEVFAKRLKELRKEKDLTLVKLEEATGVSKSTLNDLENGKRMPNAQVVATLAKFFEVTTDYILGLTDI